MKITLLGYEGVRQADLCEEIGITWVEVAALGSGCANVNACFFAGTVGKCFGNG